MRTYVGARAVVGVLLALLHLGSAMMGASPQPGVLLIVGSYAAEVLAVAAWMWVRARAPVLYRQPAGILTALTVGADAIAFTALSVTQSALSFNFGALLVLPVLMAGVVMPRRLALATAAAVTLSLLAQSWWSALLAPAGPSPWLASGLAGIGLFAIAWLSGELTARLLREERSASDSRQRAHQQAEMNRLVIEEMGEGVLVLNRHGHVLAANPAARALVGLEKTDAVGGAGAAASLPGPLLDAVERAHAEGRWPPAGRELVLPGSAEQAGHKLRARIRFTRLDTVQAEWREPSEPEDLCVLLLEDERTVQVRVQQEKLAAMGRVSAGIAHEIRNPLAALAQATELLLEDGLSGDQGRLVAILSDNVQRLRRLVDDVLDALPAASVEARPVEAVSLIESAATEWSRTVRLSGDVVQLALPAQAVQVLFDPEHLRRVLVNLLENALHHSSGRASSVRVELTASAPGEALLVVSNDGSPVPPEVEIHMFEPFFSTRSRGAGLGLYICKELCERHGAAIRLQPGGSPPRHATTFEVRLLRPEVSRDQEWRSR